MTIEERLEALEREARRSRKMVRWLSALFVLCVAAWIATSAFLPQGMVVARDTADEIRTRELVVVDEMGKEGIVMDADSLTIYDKEGNPRIIASVNDGLPSLGIFDKARNPLIYMVIDGDGVPVLGIANAQQVRQIEMKVVEDMSRIEMFNKKEELRILLLSSAKGPAMFILGEDENPYIFMGLSDEHEAASLVISNRQGDTIWSAP